MLVYSHRVQINDAPLAPWGPLPWRQTVGKVEEKGEKQLRVERAKGAWGSAPI